MSRVITAFIPKEILLIALCNNPQGKKLKALCGFGQNDFEDIAAVNLFELCRNKDTQNTKYSIEEFLESLKGKKQDSLSSTEKALLKARNFFREHQNLEVCDDAGNPWLCFWGSGQDFSKYDAENHGAAAAIVKELYDASPSLSSLLSKWDKGKRCASDAYADFIEPYREERLKNERWEDFLTFAASAVTRHP